jgi:TonB family protein
MIAFAICSFIVSAIAVSVCLAGRRWLSAAQRCAVLVGMFCVLALAPVGARLFRVPERVQRVRSSVYLVVTAGDAHGVHHRGASSRDWADGMSQDWRVYVSWVWGIVAAVLLMRIAYGVVSLRAARTPRASWAQSSADELRLRVGLRRSVAVVTGPATAIPETHGFLRPVIALPVEARSWSMDRLAFVLTHELIHVRRHDWITGLFAEIVAAMYWFNPLVWKALLLLRQERELACDDEVLLAGIGEETTYASHLIEIAASLGCRASAGSVAMAHVSNLETRVRSIVAPDLKRGGLNMKGKIVAAVVTAAALVLTSGLQAPAQGNAGLSGTVQDASGAYVPAAVVLVQNAADGSKREITRTTADGSFRFPSLPPGRYQLEVTKPGFQLYRHREVLDLQAGSAQQVSAMLQLGRVAETLTVSGVRPPQTAAAQASASGPQRIRVGGNVQSAKVVHQERPVYPQAAKAQGIEGSVLLEAVIGKDGRILNLRSVNSLVDPDLAAEAIRAVRLWEYAPTLLNGEPVEIATNITINFTLEK